MAQVASELISITNNQKLADSKYIQDEALENKKQSDINKDSLAGGVYNVTKLHQLQSGYYTITTAIAAVPQALRCVGMVITYQTASDSWETKQFKGILSDWTDSSKWEDFGGGKAGDGVYDISEAYPNASPFASLKAALTAFTDTTKKKGGMAVKYLGTDGKYHQYRYIKPTTTGFNRPNNWEEVVDTNTLFLAEYETIDTVVSRNYGINSSGIWTTSAITHYIVKVYAGMKIKVTANGEKYTMLYWLKNNNEPVNNSPAPISDIDSAQYVIQPGEDAIITAPSDAEYLFIYGTNGNDVYTPSNIKFVDNSFPQKDILERQLEEKDVEVYNQVIVNNNGVWKWRNNDGDKHSEIDVSPGDLVRVTAHAISYVFFLKEHVVNPTAGNDAPVSDVKSYRVKIKANETQEFIVPADTHVIYIAPLSYDFDDLNVSTSHVKQDVDLSASFGVVAGDEKDFGWSSGTVYVFNARTYVGKKIIVACDDLLQQTIQIMLRKADGTGVSNIDVDIHGGVGHANLPNNDEIAYIYISSKYGQSYIIEDDGFIGNIIRTGNKYKESLASSIIAEGKCISSKDYLYAFGLFNWYADNKIFTGYAANIRLDADDPTIPSDSVVSEYALYDGTITHHISEVSSAVDQNGNTIVDFEKTMNRIRFCTLDNKVGLWSLFGVPSSGDSSKRNNYSFGYNRDYDIDSTQNVITIAKLKYGNVLEDFTINKYRKMLYDLGLTSSIKTSNQNNQDNCCIIVDKDNDCYYVVLCSAQGATGDNTAFPLVLLKSLDLATWEYVGALDGGADFSAYEIQAQILNGKIYLVYRNQVANGYGCIVSNFETLETIHKQEWTRGCVLSRPCCFDLNGEVYIGFNTNPTVFAVMDEVNQDRWARRSQMSIFKFVDDVPVFQFNITNPTGFNYPWFCKVAYVQYYDCTNEGSDTALTATIPHYALNIAAFGKGVQIRMIHKHTAGAATLNISNTGAKTLYYNNAAVSSSNTWDDGEVLDVFYNKSTGRYMATPADTTPRYGTESLYVCWSEDRRYLYRRQLANISIANITPVFTKD